ncbi:MAG: glutamate racemase [Thiohalomonadaceae bacterium]
MQQAGFIGVFDSGVGGLSVLRAIRELLPAENLLYIADSAHAPYGDLTPARIRERSEHITRHLVERGAKAVVVACNTATAIAVEHLRTLYSLPIVAIEPAVKPAVHRTSSGTVGVLATSATLASPRYAALLARYGDRARVVAQACPGLVERIEQGDWGGADTRRLLREYLAPLLAAGADQIVLGCTHYPFLRPLIAEIAGPSVEVLETGPAVAAELRRRLLAAGTLQECGRGEVRFLTSGDPQRVAAVLLRLWPEDVALEAWRE